MRNRLEASEWAGLALCKASSMVRASSPCW